MREITKVLRQFLDSDFDILKSCLDHIADPYAFDPHAGDDLNSLVANMQDKAKGGLLLLTSMKEEISRLIIEEKRDDSLKIWQHNN